MPDSAASVAASASSLGLPLRRPALAAAVLLGLVVGCGGNQEEQRRAYQAARDAADREKVVLRNMTRERDRLLGEYQMHEFESRVWSGQFVPHRALLGISLAPTVGEKHTLASWWYRKWPVGACGQIDRLLARRPEVLPWYDRNSGETYRRRLADRYVRQLNLLNDRRTLQQGRVRDAEEYANIIKPEGFEE